nr:hypothetical protein [Escherichia coli]
MHTFASLMYDVYESFGLFQKGARQADIRGSANFSGHQRFFDNNDDEELMEEKRYDEIIRHLDEEGCSVRSKEGRFFINMSNFIML